MTGDTKNHCGTVLSPPSPLSPVYMGVYEKEHVGDFIGTTGDSGDTGDSGSQCDRALYGANSVGQCRLMTIIDADRVPAVTKPTKPKVPSKRVRHAVDLIIAGRAKTKADAAAQAGLSRERLSRAMKEGHVQEYLAAQTRVLLAQSQSTAAATLMTLMEEAKSEHVRKDIAVTLLSFNGIRADADRGPLVSIAFGAAGPGYVIDLRLDQSKPGISNIGEGGGVVLDEPAAEMRDVTPRAIGGNK